MSADEEQIQRQRDFQLHASQLQEPVGPEEDTEAAEILRYLSTIDDLPIDPENDPVMGQLVSKLASTANLSAEQVRSGEWVNEIILLLYQCKFPRPGGLTGWWRGYAYGDPTEERQPMDPETRMMLEAFTGVSSKRALSRSEDAKVVEESTRTIKESVVNDRDNGGSGGLKARLGL